MNNESVVAKELQEEIAIYKQMVEDLRKEMDGGKTEVTRDEINRAMSTLYDPYDVKDPFAIRADIPPDAEFPEGQVLQWKSPRYRERRGWRGWLPMQWGDKYAPDREALSKFLPDAPERMIGPDQVDSYIRRGDLILSRIDKRIKTSRDLKRELLSAQQRGAYQSGQEETIREGLRIVGKGLQRDEHPRQKSSDSFQEFDKESGMGVHRTELMGEDLDG
jgi:hypothetical protein